MIPETYGFVFGHLVGLFGLGTSPSQTHYLRWRAQHRNARKYIHASSGIRIHDPSVRAVEDRTCVLDRAAIGTDSKRI
jgi:hypothetical protein